MANLISSLSVYVYFVSLFSCAVTFAEFKTAVLGDAALADAILHPLKKLDSRRALRPEDADADQQQQQNQQ